MRLLLPIDPNDRGFVHSLRALERIARDDDEVHVFHATEPPIEWVSDRTGPGTLDIDPARRSLEKALREKGLTNATVHVAQRTSRQVADAIIELAAHIDADLVMMPTHGRTGLSRFVLGSVTEEVVRRAHCDVYVVRVPNERG